MGKGQKFFLIAFLLMLIFGCGARHITPGKYGIESDSIQNLKGGQPITIKIPKFVENEYHIANANPKIKSNFYINLNELHNDAKVLIETELKNHDVPLSSNAQKFLKITFTNLQWESWAGGFTFGVYLNFDVETSDGYSINYQVQDSGRRMSRAIGGSVSRAVEKMFQDFEIIKFINK